METFGVGRVLGGNRLIIFLCGKGLNHFLETLETILDMVNRNDFIFL